MRDMKRYVIMLLVSFFALSCTDKLAQLEVVEFGAALVDEDCMPLEYKAGRFAIKVVSDGDFIAEIVEGESWLHFEGGESTYSGSSADMTIYVFYDVNRTVLRSGKIALTRKHRKVEIDVTQLGILSEDFSIDQQNLWIGAEGGFLSSKVLTLSGSDDVSIQTEYVEEGLDQWISQARMENNYLKFNVAENMSPEPRHAIIVVSKKGTNLSGRIQVGQAGAGTVYTYVTVPELKSMIEFPGSMQLEGHVVLKGGIVLNDNLEGNGAENINVTSIVQDLEVADRTLYVSDAEGQAGVRLDFNAGTQLLVKRFDHVELDLSGATLTWLEDPDRFVVSGLNASAVMSNEVGNNGDVVIKQRKMSELTPSDVYTLVELIDCEIPVRKGPYIGVDVRHYNLINKYPMVIRDAEGGTMHMMVNTTCSWHRDGTGMPQGSGSITGVIVHEHCDNFEWDQAAADAMVSSGLGLDYVTDLGHLGQYQIRPVTKREIALADDFEDGFSKLVCEFTYIYSDVAQLLIPNYVDNVMFSTDGEYQAMMTLQLRSGDKSEPQSISTKRDWTLIGPYKDGQITDVNTGNGVYCYGQSAVWFSTSSQENLGHTQARIDKACGSAWNATAWSVNKFWQVDVSTKGLTAENGPMSIQLGAVNGYGDRVGGPRYWKMVVSTSDDASESVIAEYTVPDFPQNGNRRVWHCPGHKYMSFNIPEHIDVWDKDRITIKMVPVNTKADNGDSYSSGTINKDVDHSMNYFAIRCNK